jgi:hypothetical protein
VTVKMRRYGTGHAYYVDGAKVPGVTTVLGATMPKNALVDWAARKAADEVIDYWAELVELRPSERYNRVRGAHNRDRDRAARRGTEVHKLAEALNNDEPVTPPEELRGHVEAYRDFLDSVGVEPVQGATELVVASRTHRYCGMVDLIADLPAVFAGAELVPPSRWLLEIKTTRSGVFPESALQSCAYTRAEMYVHPDHPDDEQPMSLLGIQRCGVVWVKSDAWELRPVDTGEVIWSYFVHLRWLFDHADDLSGWVGNPAVPGPVEAAAVP